MKIKFLLANILSVMVACLVGRAAESTPSPVVVLSDGAKLTLLGVTHGKHHVAPNYESIGGNIQTGNWINRPNDATVVWLEVEHNPSRWPSFSLLVSDEANTGCLTAEVTTRCHVKDGVEVHGFLLQAFPRWEKKIVLRIASPYGQELSKEKIVIDNPQLTLFVRQATEPLPSTKSDGDFEVTLTKLVAGAPLPPYARAKDVPPGDPQNQCARISFDFKQGGRSVTNWHPWLVDVSDDVGNHVRTSMQFQDNEFMRQHTIRTSAAATNAPVYAPADDYKGYFLKPGLWPDEPAWTVRLEFTRNSGFDDDEIMTLTNLPVRRGTEQDWNDEWSGEPTQTNLFLGDYMLNGIKLKLFYPLLRPDPYQTNQMRLSVLMRANPNPESERMRITLLKATDDQGRDLWSPLNPTAWLNCTFDFPNSRDLKTLNLKFALHKSRVVEFTVKPQKQ